MVNDRKSMSWRRKTVFSAIVFVAFFVLLELTLAACGVLPWRLAEDPYVGFQSGAPLFLREGENWRTNPVKRGFFNDQSFPVQKGPRTIRVFCLGGSTTFGHPYDYRTSFSNWLRERLQDAAPDQEWEVINCGGISYASYRVCLLMEELNNYQPDVFVVYTGHNEFLESRTYGEDAGRSGIVAWLGPIVSKTRVATVMATCLRSPERKRKPINAQERTTLPGEVDTILERSVGPSEYHRDRPWHDAVVRHYRLSLERICGLARVGGARVMFVTPASNQRDFSPFKSQQGELSSSQLSEWEKARTEGQALAASGNQEAAARELLRATELDPEHALGLWEAARAAMAVGQEQRARDLFQRAVDEDVCPLRAYSRLVSTLEEVAAEQGVPLIDFPRILAEQHPEGPGNVALGDEDFLDHVHPTIEGHRLLAWSIFDQMVQWKIAPPQEMNEEVAKRLESRVMNGIDSRAQALALVQVIQVLSWAGKNEEALRLTDRAEAVHPGLSDVSSYRGRLFEKMGNEKEAMAAYREAIERNPSDALALARAGFLSLRAEKHVDARAFLATAVLNMPVHSPVRFKADCRFGLALAFYHLEQWEEASLEFEATLKLVPDYEGAREHLNEVKQKLGR